MKKFTIKSFRFLACPNLYTVAIYENELIGYICYFPITDSLYDSISDADRFYNNNIRAHDIADLDKDFDNHIYLLSVAIRKEYQERGIGSSLMLKMLDAINHNIKNDYAISDITATAVDDRSGRLLQKYGFTTIGNLYEHNEYKLMQLRLTKGR
jgi:ribosomal protein S18 acetylase RimI-like enzyme